ncbi:hypothetical protein PY092_17020 [Muricauda sp. 334s03]|uniref:Uncharacterized protein n=1 Tax=Flagellimonas yonaguniensis TaxID=3031325 RepID=A0ABT5Y3F8_9FLAO|nr:hypothetical protein [[Muricauda] yonaguniensis]MDF0717869.1 hypothetical protein [[Muricauda] yonaguniensis]
MKSKLTLIVTFLFVLLACKEDCNECFTPPQPLLFELIGLETGANLISNGTYSSNDIKVVDQSNNQALEFSIVQDGDIDLININSIGWESEAVNYQIIASDNLIFSLQVNAERITEGCCSYTKFTTIEISHSNYEIDYETGIYRVFIE